MKYSKSFNRDYNWYLSVIKDFCFDGVDEHRDKKGNPLVRFSPAGKIAKECFYLYDSCGKVEPTCEPVKLKKLYRTKGSVNLHIRMYAEDRASGLLSKFEFEDICIRYKVPEWFVSAVENQKTKFQTCIT